MIALIPVPYFVFRIKHNSCLLYLKVRACYVYNTLDFIEEEQLRLFRYIKEETKTKCQFHLKIP